MERIWAPWRMKYILEEHVPDATARQERPADACIFCDLPAEGPDKQKDNLILSCGERAFVIFNRYPYNNGHMMVVPRAHVSDPMALSPRDFRILTELLRRTTDALAGALQCHGINLGMNLGRTAGAGIDKHCHYHLVPRWDGDTNFMPVVGQVKVISEDLWATYDRLLPVIGGLAREVEEELT
jgi:ATP adenylyltransferase